MLYSSFRAALLAGGCVCSSVAAAPFTVDAGSYLQADTLGVGTDTDTIFLGYSGLVTQSIPAVGASGVGRLDANGMMLWVWEINTAYQSASPSSVASLRCNLHFTPTVPNLSYKLDGFLNVGKSGSPTLMRAVSTVHLAQNVGLGVIHYRNHQSYSGPCTLWDPTAFQLGAQTGDLIMGQQYVYSVELSLAMTHGGDSLASLYALLSGSPFVQLQLIQRPCDGDLSGDGIVDDADFAYFAAAYEILDCADPAMPPGCPADLNHDGFVDDSDFVVFAASYDRILCP